MDLTVLAMLITILVAILAPLLTAIIQGRYSLKLRTLDAAYSDKIAAYKEFIAAYAELVIGEGTVGQYRRVITAVSQAQLYTLFGFDQSQQLLDMLLGAERGVPYNKEIADNLFQDCVHFLRLDIHKHQ